MTITSTSGSASSSRSAADTSVTAAAPCTVTSRISNTTLGQRRLAFSTTSFSASVLRPQIRPTFLGKSGRLTFLSESNKPSAASRVLSASNLANNSPTPTCLISRADKVSEPFFVYQLGFANITTRAFAGSGWAAAITDLWHITDSDISSLGSRRRINAITPLRSLSSLISPSTQIGPKRSTYSFIASVTTLTVAGASLEVSNMR